MRKNNNYPIDLKLEAVHLHEVEGYGYRTVAKMLEVNDVSRIKAWVKKHRKGETFEDMRAECGQNLGHLRKGSTKDVPLK